MVFPMLAQSHWMRRQMPLRRPWRSQRFVNPGQLYRGGGSSPSNDLVALEPDVSVPRFDHSGDHASLEVLPLRRL